jgi:uncharacterized MAPEG superfamily protein
LDDGIDSDRQPADWIYCRSGNRYLSIIETLEGNRMKLPFVCLALVLLLPYLLASYGAYYRKKSLGVVDNDNPRAQAAQLDAYGARIYASQQNAWEAATLFSASLLAAKVAGVSVSHMIVPSMLFLAFRILHPIAYIKGWSNIRSTASTAGLSCCAWLLVSAAIAA